MDFVFCSLSIFYSKLELSPLTACTVQSMIEKINDSVAKKNPTNKKKIIISNVRVKTMKNPKTTMNKREKEHTGETNLLCHFSGSINFVPFWASVLRASPLPPPSPSLSATLSCFVLFIARQPNCNPSSSSSLFICSQLIVTCSFQMFINKNY